MFYSYNVIMNKKLCLAETQKSTETCTVKKKTLLAHMNRFHTLGQGRFPIVYRTDMTSIKFINIMMITTSHNMIKYKNITY